jgi:chromosome segregation ATPase
MKNKEKEKLQDSIFKQEILIIMCIYIQLVLGCWYFIETYKMNHQLNNLKQEVSSNKHNIQSQSKIIKEYSDMILEQDYRINELESDINDLETSNEIIKELRRSWDRR